MLTYQKSCVAHARRVVSDEYYKTSYWFSNKILAIGGVIKKKQLLHIKDTYSIIFL